MKLKKTTSNNDSGLTVQTESKQISSASKNLKEADEYINEEFPKVTMPNRKGRV